MEFELKCIGTTELPNGLSHVHDRAVLTDNDMQWTGNEQGRQARPRMEIRMSSARRNGQLNITNDRQTFLYV